MNVLTKLNEHQKTKILSQILDGSETILLKFSKNICITAKKWAEKTIFLENSLLFYINALFVLYLAIICFVCINILQIIHERA